MKTKNPASICEFPLGTINESKVLPAKAGSFEKRLKAA